MILEQIEFIADQQLTKMKNHTLFDRLNFALTWLWRFCEVYQLFLEHGILLADRHGGNIGFNETHLPPMPDMDFPGATLRIPVMLDLAPYWKDDTETQLWLSVPTWIPVAMDLLEHAFHPETMNSERRHVHSHLRTLAMPVNQCQKEQLGQLEQQSQIQQQEIDQEIDTLISQSVTFWLDDQEESPMKEEAKQWLPRLLAHGGTFHDQARTVEEWVKVLHTETKRVIDTLNQWKDSSEFCFMEECTKVNAETAPQSLLANLTGAEIQCHQCSRCFRTLADYKKHYEHHKQGKLKVCNVCGGGYTRPEQHLRIHTGEKPYKCEHPDCGKAFTQSRDLAHHTYIHTGEKPYKCEHPGCGKAFAQKSVLNKHLRTHTGEKPYKCEHPGCGKAFTQMSILKTHLRSHTGEKPYKCEYCNNRFTQRSHLASHLRTHTGEKPYKCKFCSNVFATSTIRNTHQKTCKKNKLPD